MQPPGHPAAPPQGHLGGTVCTSQTARPQLGPLPAAPKDVRALQQKADEYPGPPLRPKAQPLNPSKTNAHRSPGQARAPPLPPPATPPRLSAPARARLSVLLTITFLFLPTEEMTRRVEDSMGSQVSPTHLKQGGTRRLPEGGAGGLGCRVDNGVSTRCIQMKDKAKAALSLKNYRFGAWLPSMTCPVRSLPSVTASP